MVRVDFPKFVEGDDPLDWVYRAEQYFDYFSIAGDKRVKMVSFHLDREFLQWYQWEDCAKTLPVWEDFTKAFCREFGSQGFEDYAESLFKLRQTGSLRDYVSEFRRLATWITNLSPTFRLSCFIGGLKEELKHDVKLLRPATVQDAMNLAVEVDLKFQKLRSFGFNRMKMSALPTKNEISSIKPNTETKEKFPIRKLTPEEIQYKRENNLCFYCDDRYVRGHKCPKKQILLLDIGYNSSDEDEIVQELQNREQTEITACCITACALFGTPSVAIKTMKVRAVIKNVPVIVLFDSGSSHNFVDHALVKKLGLPMDASVVYDVMIGDGGQIKSKGGCSAVTIKFDQYDYTSDMLSLPLGGCDVVLGVQWLRTLGPVLWDFEKLSMEFWLNGVKVYLSSAKPQPLQHITSQQMGVDVTNLNQSLAMVLCCMLLTVW
ncbi:hypothetical protein LWI29_003302 [Acer saccharum]|uniref:Retrotransposon gag domain-containing protein n=1 Tax=Acer saccharum TaxID=4024 RepID=A0AA39VAH8_ACESA|nr:hypothetical protein LWI29_003302 [Acer saccharum]